MSTRSFPFASLLIAVCLTASVQAGYDFEPPSLRSFVRFWGIGPGPGYHAVPCTPRGWLHYRCVTRGFAPMPVESDYFPETVSSLRASSLIANDPFLPYGGLDTNARTPTPADETLPAPVEAPSEPSLPDTILSPAVPPPPAPPTPTLPHSFPIETRHVPTTPRQAPGNSLLDELIQEQEVKLREIDAMLNELGSPPVTPSADDPAASSRPAAGDSWW